MCKYPSKKPVFRCTSVWVPHLCNPSIINSWWRSPLESLNTNPIVYHLFCLQKYRDNQDSDRQALYYLSEDKIQSPATTIIPVQILHSYKPP